MNFSHVTRLNWLRIISLRIALSVCLLVLTATVGAQSIAPASPVPQPHPRWLDQTDIYAKVFGGVLAGLGTLFGLPVVLLNFKKTKAEIRKLELEALALESKGEVRGDTSAGISILVKNSDHATVQVLADPRFLGPLLLLLDFIFAWVVLTIAGYFIGMFPVGALIRASLLLVIAGILLVPIAREARRVRVVRRPKEVKE